jgi:WD40 repeat protein
MLGELRAYDAATGKMLAMQTWAHNRPISAIAVRPDGGTIVTYGGDGTVRAWEVSGLTLTAEWDAPETDDNGGYIGFIDNDTIAVSALEHGSNQPKPTCVLSWKDAGKFRRWNIAQSGAVFRLVALSSNFKYTIFADSANNIGFFDNASGAVLRYCRSPIPSVFSLYAPTEQPLAVAGPYEGKSAYVAAEDSLVGSHLPELPSTPLKRWLTVSVETPAGRFTTSDYLDWFGTLDGRPIRAGQAGFPSGLAQPHGWVAIQDSGLLAAIGRNVILLYSPRSQHVTHVYRLLSSAVHATYDPTSRALLVVHGDGVLRRWPVPPNVF